MRGIALATAAVAFASHAAVAAFPGANGRLVFTREGEIWSIRPDRAGAVNLSDVGDNDDASWSPDGSKIAFSSDRDGSADIWVIDADGRNPTQITSGPDDDDHPAWSPDGARLVFTRGSDGDEDVHVIDLDGTGLQNLTNDPSDDDSQPHWSPDGTQIVFSADDDIWVIGPDGSGRTNLTNDGTNNDRPHWSPDGTRIAFQSDRDGDLEIFVMNADGTGVTQLTFDGAGDEKPAFSPDGTAIAFETDRDGSSEVYVMDADGGNPTRITDGPEDDADPDWQPRAFTTTTITTLPTTTTTVPGGATAAGRRLVLKDAPGKPQKRKLAFLAKGRDVAAGTENGGAGDPVLHGGFLEIVSRDGDRFSTSYDLPAASWRYKGKAGRNKGYRLANAGPIRKVVVKPGKTLAIVAQGSALGHTLGADPGPVHVAIGLGDQRYCFTFGGKTKFKAGKTFLAKNAPVPTACEALLPACGDAVLEPGESCPILEGGTDALAVEATSNFDGEPGVPLEEIAVEAGGARIARTRVDVEFAPDATVAQVNAVLAQLGGDITVMLANVPLLVVRIADPGSLSALDALLAAANTDPAVRVSRGHLDDPDELPANFVQPETSDLTKIDNHIAVRAPAAWNARAAIEAVPLLVVGDSFGNGRPTFDSSALPLNPSDFGVLVPDDHGYHVLGIMTATFGGDGPCAASGASPLALRGCATGMLPVFAPLRVVDGNAFFTGLAFRMLLIERALVLGNVVVNTSRNDCSTGMCSSLAIAGAKAREWVLMVRGAGLEGRMLHLTSAGNIADATPGVTDAQKNSSYSAAALLPAIPDFFGSGTLPNLVNTLVVENVVNGSAPTFTPLCLRDNSKRGGHLSGIGSFVWSHTDASTGANDLSGTSMSTPQVAGLAAYLWAIDPDMTVTQLAGLLRLTTTAVAGSGTGGVCDAAGTAPAPIIDAYAAVLALDQATLPTPTSAPVRHALFDLDGNDDFDEDDLFELQAVFIDSSTGLVQEPSVPAFQRYDLNGDGFTGGAQRRVAFDLDREGSTQYGTSQFGQVTQDVEGVPVPFDETDLTDVDILCYYAYSDLYAGDEERRRDYLGLERCARITMTVDFPSTIEPGLSETLRVSVGREGTGGSEPVPGIHIELGATGGDVIPASGTTDAEGEFTAQAELAPDSSSIEIVVQALSAPGGEVLAEEVVVAAGPCTDAPSDVEIDFGNGEDDPTVVGPTLQNGLEYRLTTSGTFTVNSVQQWQNGVCKGAPAAGEGGPTGIDTEFFFAVPVGSALCAPDFECCPNHTSKFQISLDGGGAFEHVEPVSAAFEASHVYEYLVRGRGMPVHLRLAEDSSRGDDYGIVRINIACASDSTTTTTTSTTSTSTTSTTETTTTTTSIPTTTDTSSSTTTTSTPSSTTTTSLIVGVPVVPYRRYAAAGPDGPVVMLVDEFATETVDLGAVILELPPVTIDGELPFDPVTHQTCHAHPGGTLDACIDIQDRFGFAPLRVGDPVGVCVPELGASIAVDAFKCYAASGSALEVDVLLADDFQSQTVTVGAPELLCTPVEVDEAPLASSIRYLVCYATTPPGAAGGQIEVENVLHVDPISVDVGVATGLCVPAVRQLVASCELCGNGVLDGDEECDDVNVLDGDGCSAVCAFELDCTCDGVPVPPPSDEGCATLADCGVSCTACTAGGGGTCGCQ